MTAPSHDTNILPAGWRDVDPSEGEELKQELSREVPEGHLLWGASVQAVAVRKHRKDAVFWAPAREQWAWVHLTWTVEREPRWPSTVVANRWEDLAAEIRD